MKGREFNPYYIAVVFCTTCGSNRVDVLRWKGQHVAVFRCHACGHEQDVPGFTIGRATGPKVLTSLGEAVQDTASYDLAELVTSTKAGGRHAS